MNDFEYRGREGSERNRRKVKPFIEEGGSRCRAAKSPESPTKSQGFKTKHDKWWTGDYEK